MKRTGLLITLISLLSLAFAPAVLAAAPTNDTWAGRTVVSQLIFQDLVDTTEATTDTDDAQANNSCGAPATDASVWFEYTPTADQVVLIDVSESTYTAGVLVAVGGPGTFETIACGPDSIDFFAVAGTAYSIIAIDDQYDGGGNGGQLLITMQSAPPPPTLDLSVDSTARFNRDGSATVTGMVTCAGDAGYTELYGYLSQTVGRYVVRGDGWSSFDCDGATHAWSMTITPYNGLFKGGKAASLAVAFACGYDCAESVVEQTVFLKK